MAGSHNKDENDVTESQPLRTTQPQSYGAQPENETGASPRPSLQPSDTADTPDDVTSVSAMLGRLIQFIRSLVPVPVCHKYVPNPDDPPSDYLTLCYVAYAFFWPVALCALWASSSSRESCKACDYLKARQHGNLARNLSILAIISGVVFFAIVIVRLVYPGVR